MLSLSDNEFSVINFLVRNFTEKLTIRSIAQRLNFSAAGVFNILKKLEKEGIAVGQRLGTGLFYSINLDNKLSQHLAAIVLLYSKEKPAINVEKIKYAKSAVFDMSTLLLVIDNITNIEVDVPNVNVISKTEDEIIELFKKKDQEMMQLLKKGIVLFGEEKIVNIIKNCSRGF